MIETNRLIIRAFSEADAYRLYNIHDDESVKKWIPNESYRDIDEARDAIGFFSGCVQRGTLPYVLGVVLKDTGELIGDVGINEVDGNSGEVEIGYVIAREQMGNGYASEAVKAMTGFAAEHFGVKRLYGRVLHGNIASEKVLEKNGYEYITEEFGADDDPYGDGMLVYRKEC